MCCFYKWRINYVKKTESSLHIWFPYPQHYNIFLSFQFFISNITNFAETTTRSFFSYVYSPCIFPFFQPYFFVLLKMPLQRPQTAGSPPTQHNKKSDLPFEIKFRKVEAALLIFLCLFRLFFIDFRQFDHFVCLACNI